MLNSICGIAYRAGCLLKFGKQTLISKKNSFNDIGSYVSEMDQKSENFILEQLTIQTPDYNFCGEESGLIDRGSKYTWFVDPLDGTYNYLRGYPMWGVSIGLCYEQTPILGVLYFPDLQKMYYAEEEMGAFCNEEKINVSDLNFTEGCYSIPSFIYQGKKQANEELINNATATKIHHCSTFDFACLAEGNTEVIVSGTLAPWDSCAGVCLVREAGGSIVDFRGEEWIMSSDSLIASNKFNSSLLAIIQRDEPQIINKNFLIPGLNQEDKMTEGQNLSH